MHQHGIIVCDEAATDELKVGTYKYFKDMETRFYLLMLPGDKVFKTKDLSAQIGSSRLSFAKAEYMEQYLDITPGSLSVLGLMNDKDRMVRLLIDTCRDCSGKTTR